MGTVHGEDSGARTHPLRCRSQPSYNMPFLIRLFRFRSGMLRLCSRLAPSGLLKLPRLLQQ